MPIPPDFEAEALYARDAWCIHDVTEIDVEGNRVVAVIDTTRLGPLVRAQRPFASHTEHLPGAYVIQATGTLGQLHAIYCLGMRATEGWVGFGTRIKKARFPRLGLIGPPVRATLTVSRVRNFRGTRFIDGAFEFVQEGEVIYESQQSSAWVCDDAARGAP